MIETSTTAPASLVRTTGIRTASTALASNATRPTTTTRLLHIEDNLADALLFQQYILGVVPAVEFETVARSADVTPETISADCAILDLSLPDADGLEALRTLRSVSQDLPIIVMTRSDDLDLAVDALRHGADDYLVKYETGGPAIRRAIRYAIERRRLRKELITEAAATAIATAQIITAEAALGVANAQALTAEIATAVANAQTLTAETATAIAIARTATAETALGVAHAQVTTATNALEVANAEIDTAAEAAFQANESRWKSDAVARDGSRADSHSATMLLSTHEVAVRIDDVTGDYVLRCGTCDWEAARGSEKLHSWRERNLDTVLLRHVDFADLLADREPSATQSRSDDSGTPSGDGTRRSPDHTFFGPLARDDSERPVITRRHLLQPGSWLNP